VVRQRFIQVVPGILRLLGLVDSLKLGGRIPRKDVHMPKRRAPYPPEFRTEAIRLVRSSGKPMAQIARELDVTSETLRIWVKQAAIDDGERHDGPTTEEHPEGTREVRRLRREVKTLREEREILLKAATFFANPQRVPGARSGPR